MLQKIGFQPGINKQISETGAEAQWVNCDNVRFRYGTPEKIGGWKQLGLYDRDWETLFFVTYYLLTI